MADMSLSDRYDYLKAAKASIYNNVREGGGGGSRGRFEDQRGTWERRGDRVSPDGGDEGTVASGRERAGVVGQGGCALREGSSPVLWVCCSQTPGTAASSVAPAAALALGADKVPPPERRLSRAPGTQVSPSGFGTSQAAVGTDTIAHSRYAAVFTGIVLLIRCEGKSNC